MQSQNLPPKKDQLDKYQMDKRMASAKALDTHKSTPNWDFGTRGRVGALAKTKSFAKYNI